MERTIIFTNDMDGVHFVAPPPHKTLIGLLKGNLSLPSAGRPIENYEPRGGLSTRFSVLFHQIRPFIRGSLEGLELFRQSAEKYDRDLSFAVLSGRQPDKHQMTIRRLEQSGRGQYFSDYFLNEGASATTWKETTVRKLTESGSNVVHIDDDLRAGLCVARVNLLYPDEPRVLVYILQNLSNNPLLLRHAQISLPPNLHIVDSFHSAAVHFDDVLSRKKI